MKKCLVLFSGGIDSTTCLYWARLHFAKVQALSFDYGQRHRIELALARKICRQIRIPQTVIKIDLRPIGGSSLTDRSLRVPTFTHIDEFSGGPPPTYVPFRNGIFLALAAAWAEVRGIRDIICGFNVMDSPQYPDTRQEFVKAMESAVNSGTKFAFSNDKLKIIAPFVKLKKSAIIKKGLCLGADYSYSISCYRGREIPCQQCSSCLLRQRAWEEAGSKDPLMERLEKEGKI